MEDISGLSSDSFRIGEVEGVSEKEAEYILQRLQQDYEGLIDTYNLEEQSILNEKFTVDIKPNGGRLEKDKLVLSSPESYEELIRRLGGDWLMENWKDNEPYPFHEGAEEIGHLIGREYPNGWEGHVRDLDGYSDRECFRLYKSRSEIFGSTGLIDQHEKIIYMDVLATDRSIRALLEQDDLEQEELVELERKKSYLSSRLFTLDMVEDNLNIETEQLLKGDYPGNLDQLIHGYNEVVDRTYHEQ